MAACDAVGRCTRRGLVPVALEILDQRIIQVVEDGVFAAGLPRDAGAVLLLELDGAASALRTEAESVRRMLAESGAREVRVARDAAERERGRERWGPVRGWSPGTRRQVRPSIRRWPSTRSDRLTPVQALVV